MVKICLNCWSKDDIEDWLFLRKSKKVKHLIKLDLSHEKNHSPMKRKERKKNNLLKIINGSSKPVPQPINIDHQKVTKSDTKKSDKLTSSRKVQDKTVTTAKRASRDQKRPKTQWSPVISGARPPTASPG